MLEENELLLEHQDDHPQAKVTSTPTSTLCKLWKFFFSFLLLMVISVWIMFTFSPHSKSKKWLRTQDSKRVKDLETSLYSKNCSLLQQVNATSKWSGFKEIVPGTIIYSAFYDDTDPNSPFVRIIAISETFRPPRILCHSRCDLAQTEEAVFHLVKDHKSRRHAAFIVSCTFPRGLGREPGFIDISAEYDDKMTEVTRYPVQSTNDTPHIHNYTICVPPLYGSIPMAKFIEFIELNRIFGATHFVFYDLKLNPAIRHAINIYQSQGAVTLLPWNLPVYVRDFYSIHYHGQFVAIHDCLYRNRGRSRWVGFHDLDEFIVPLVHPTLPLLLNEIDSGQSSGFSVQSTVFPLNSQEKVQANESLITQSIFYRTKKLFHKSREKCIVSPRKVFEMSIHYIVKSSSAKYEKSSIDPKKALVFHYRSCVQFDDLKAACKSLVPENFMKRYKTRLKIRVDHVMEHLKG
ncbi:beta-1,4-galactosyltransferase galt-1-like [Actinia tenebrosa]|uniref:Glycosyltransferase family 92 protein n=1 Tax=Actinia tenebrosa TaxID=6105 RepID=A0A6P8IBD5_ACTTE|nr:beta-1,4-galactosyltransferase galt-1-like [Actinia tenebrosa]